MGKISEAEEAQPHLTGGGDGHSRLCESHATWHTELTRVREVYRYLEPWETNIRPTITTRAQTEGKTPAPLVPASDWTPVGCEDTALAAFAQLGALRLNVQRCMISLVSKDQEIILAESTRTLSLQSDLVHTKSDALWLGTTSFPRGQGMGCIGLREWKKTREIRDSPPEDDHYYEDGISNHYHIISDMRQKQHHDLHDRLFVRCAKTLRFYASVPIRTPSGTVIGCYAVLDEAPRFGISAREMEFLEDIADTVMGHLEAKRATMQRQRGDRLVKGLALFNGGKTSLREWWLANYSRHQRGEGQRRRRRSSSEEELRGERADEEFGQTYRAQDLDPRGRLIHSAPSEHQQAEPRLDQSTIEPKREALTNEYHEPKEHAASKSEESDNVTPSTTDQGINGVSQEANDVIASAQVPSKKPDGFDLPKETGEVFARASNLIRESLNAEGVLFVDTDFPRSDKQRRGRYKKGKRGGEGPESPGDASISATTTENETDSGKEGRVRTPDSGRSNPLDDSPCALLGFSTKIKSSLRGFQASQKHSSMSKSFMNRLLRRYPHGKIFNYYNGRSLSSSSGGEGSTQSVESVSSSSVSKAKTNSKEARDAAMLAELVSEPRSVAFLPLWDDRRDRWRAGVLVWNVAPNRYLDLEEDVTYLAAFGNSLMAELARLEVIAADQAKATFISSVSHELRSPLHGVLAGVEFLQESQLDPYQKEMTTTISMAGKTLLDTINNILDFTKINSFTDTQRNDRKDRDMTRHMAFKSADVGEVGVTSPVDLADLTENVVDTLVTANQFRASIMKKSKEQTRRQSTSSSSSPGSPRAGTEVDEEEEDEPILVVLDIAKRSSWRLNTSPGSWTRIITNLVGNAFKYTKAGTITVTLQCGKTNRNGKTEVQLMIEDTGQGISQDFQKHHLWTPFMQENTHAIGTGLGLSIVKQVIEDVGGNISVESEVGRGTKIRVSLLADFLADSAPDCPDPEPGSIVPNNTRLGFVSSSGRSEQARRDRRMRSVVSQTCSEWIGCTYEDVKGSPEGSTADVCFMIESDFEQWSNSKRLQGHDAKTIDCGDCGRPGPPIIVLSALVDPAARRLATNQDANIIFINQPFGPRKLSRTIKAALDMTNTRSIRNPAKRKSQAQNSRQRTNSNASQRRPTEHQPQSAPQSPTEYSAPSSPNPQHGKVLLVEDNTVNMKLLIATMRKLQRPYETAENGLDAVQQYASSPSSFVLILMDMSMPIMDGFTATETIRVLEEKNRWRRCMIIALTGVASAEARQRAFTSGVDTFLTKPASMQKLKGIVEDLED